MATPEDTTFETQARITTAWVLGALVVAGGVGLAVLALQPSPPTTFYRPRYPAPRYDEWS